MSEPKQIACEVWSRIVGYYRPIQDWNPSKVLEFSERKTYVMQPATEGERAELDIVELGDEFVDV